jgi:hypothetical protein
MFFPQDVLSLRTFFPMDVLLPSVQSPDVLSPDFFFGHLNHPSSRGVCRGSPYLTIKDAPTEESVTLVMFPSRVTMWVNLFFDLCICFWRAYIGSLDEDWNFVCKKGTQIGTDSVIAITLCYILELLHNASTLWRKVITSFSYCAGLIEIIIALA